MSKPILKTFRLSERDLEFLVDTVFPGVTDKARLKQIVQEDDAFRNNFIGDERVFRRLINEEEVVLKISPTLFFEILLRKVAQDLKETSYTLEKSGTVKIPVFDTKDVVEFLKNDSLLHYLAEMLSSFTKIENYTISVTVREGIWETFRFSDLDIFSLMSYCKVVDDEYRLGFYKRIADLCLFILGIFPEYAEHDYRYPFSGHLRPHVRGKMRISPDEYEKEGRRFYKLAAEHQSARELDLSEVFLELHENFQKARKPLNFISEHYLQYKKQKLFG